MAEDLVEVKTDVVEPGNDAPSTLPIKELLVDADLPSIPFRQLVNHVVQDLNLVDVVSKIKKGTEYVVQVPLKLQKAYQQGEVFVVQNSETGVLRPMLAKWNDEGKYEFVSPMEMVEKTTTQGGSAFQGIADRYQNMAMQQQIAQLSELMEQTHEAVRRIEQGQYDDRIGLLNAGRNQIILALSNPEKIDEAELKDGRNNLQIGCAQIVQTIRRRSEEFPKIPSNRIIRDLKLFAKSNYYSDLDEDYGRIEECFDFYLQGTKMLAASYAICGENEKASIVFDQAKATLEQIDFSKVCKMALIHPTEKSWLSAEATNYIESAKLTCLEEAKHYEMLSVKISGEQLLEAFENGRTEGI